ncbi:MAG TPA: hypothetical protein VHX42_03230 [Candidatus Babeliales bacterium]|jgi:hypothetical protein|nr:hypothetical protein [Candidatus Babeliales bacterium]
MKRKISQKLLLLTAIPYIGLHAECCSNVNTEFRVAPFVQWRSQSRNVPRKLVGTTSHHVYLHDMESFYGTFNVTPQYDQTFDNYKLAEVFFGSSLINTIAPNDCNNECNKALVISGSLVPNRAPFEWMAENFYLPRDFKSVITFEPKLQDFLVDFYLYVGLDEWVKGMYFRIYGPVVNNKTSLHPCETIEQPGTIGYAPGFFSANEVPTDILLPSALSFFNGCTAVIVPGITVDPLLRAKIADHKRSITGFADLRGELGWNYLHEDYHVGFNIQAAAPTGSRPNGEFLFEPYVGNGKHWELGLGLSAHWTMWRSQDDEQHLDFIFEADVTHLFNASQQRTFDLIGKPNSRYMLAEKMNLKPTQNLFGNTEPNEGPGTVTQASSQFNSEYSPVANFSTRHVNVSIGVQGDIVAMLNYTYHGFSFDLGYNYWGMSHEDIDLTDCDNAPVFPENMWALKGDAQTFGFAQPGSPGNILVVPLSGTEMGGTSSSGTGATIHQGTNIPKATDAMPAITNPGVDNAQFAQTGDGLGSAIIHAGSITGPQVQTSIQPIFISVTDLNIEGAETRGSSNKIFSHFSYTWIDREDWIPYLGIGFDAEFGNNGNNNNDNMCDGISAALSEWAIFVKGGVSFD